MKKRSWKKKIKDACIEAGTYKPFFDIVIDQLAQIMEMRDEATAQFCTMGAKPVIGHTNKAGHQNIVKNPAMVVINECNQQALAYWRDLGLTPKGFRVLGGSSVEEKGTSFEDILSKIDI